MLLILGACRRCSRDALPKIAQQGLLRSKQKSATGSWQRFGERERRRHICPDGLERSRWLRSLTTARPRCVLPGPGFYFALQASKSHEYPASEMRALPPGTHTRSMLLCKVAKGRVFRTEANMDTLQGRAPAGHHSVLGVATVEGPLNYDELVVYDEAAILPCALLPSPTLPTPGSTAGEARAPLSSH